MAGTIKVVIVEDHAMVAEGFAAALCEEDDIHVVGIARTGEAALHLVEETAPDVVLVDFRLPDADGADVTVRIRRERPGTQVVVLTAADEPNVLRRAIEAGAAGFVHKSEPIDQVARATRAVHGGEAWFRPGALASLVGAIGRPSAAVGADLTDREREVLSLLAEGASTNAMMEALVLSPHTVRNHVRNIIMKLGAHSKLEAVTIAARAGLVSLKPGR
ncbi:MAG: response regulator transcription factor [Actinobacteria bacterium]|nr:response regulator transcription factor [Actinomycetota bacterium]